MKTAAAGLTLPALTRGGFAAEPLKVGFVYLGAIGDYGWTWSHEQGRKALVDALKGQVVADYVENVKEDASAIPVMKDLAQQGNKLIFTTSFGFMDQTIEAAKAFPDVKWEHCTGFKRAAVAVAALQSEPRCATVKPEPGTGPPRGTDFWPATAAGARAERADSDRRRSGSEASG